MTGRHFIVDPTLLVDTALQSIILTNPSVTLDAENKIVYLSAEQPAQVSVVSGGGSGHEPSFAAFVGRGLLTAAVTGTILASPDPEQVKVAIMNRVPGENGILAIVMNNQVKNSLFPSG
jgi:triose/dihydroxyacetone kinase / FAD-AMP lyase (cyclizing)